MAGRLPGSVVLITGAGSGQGQAGAVLFAREGAKLALVDINEGGLKETVDMVSKENPDTEILTYTANLTKADEISALVKAVGDKFGKIDHIYNNAGLIQIKPMEETTIEDWDRLHSINVKAPFFLVKEALPLLKKGTNGSIVNVSSGAGLVSPHAGMSPYCSSKGGMIALTKSMMQDLGPYGIRVNCLVPGFIDTPMSRGFFTEVPEEERDAARAQSVQRSIFKRPGEPEEIAAFAVFLTTKEASYANGAIITIDDGFTAM